MGRELELKFAASGEILEAIGEKYGPFTPIAMDTRYFDTPDRAFRARRWTLRLRLENGRPVCTLKIPLPDGSRGEFETESGDIVSALPALLALGAPGELEAFARAGLTEVCGARFTRWARLMDVPGGRVELALDRGGIHRRGENPPLCRGGGGAEGRLRWGAYGLWPRPGIGIFPPGGAPLQNPTGHGIGGKTSGQLTMDSGQ